MIRVLQVFSTLDRGGAESMMMNIYRNIDKSRIAFDFVVHTDQARSSEDDYADEVKKLGGSIYTAPKLNGVNLLAYRSWWIDFFRHHREYDYLHSHLRSIASIYIPIAKKNGVKTIIHSHSTSNGNGVNAIVKFILQYPLRFQADYLFSCSESSGKWLFGKKAIQQSNYLIIRNPIDTKRFAYSENSRKKIRAQFGIPQEQCLYCHVGNFTLPKNHAFLVDVFYELNKAKRSKLILVGAANGNEERLKEIKNKVASLKLTEDVIFAGGRDDVPDILSASDIFLFPSLWEGFPMAVLEAQAAGLPCYISNRVTTKVCLSDLVHYVSIDNGVSDWIEAVSNHENKRQDVSEKIIAAGYDVTDSAEWLTDFYIRNKD